MKHGEVVEEILSMEYKVKMSGDGRDLLEEILSYWIEDAAEGFADEVRDGVWDETGQIDDVVADARVLARAGAMLLQLRDQVGVYPGDTLARLMARK